MRAFSEEEQARYAAIEKEAGEVRDSIKRLESIEEHKRESARLNSAAGRSPAVTVIREDKHDEDGSPHYYGKFNRGGFGEFLRDVAAAANGMGESENLRQLRAATGANEASVHRVGSWFSLTMQRCCSRR